MQTEIKILRKKEHEEETYWQTFLYESDNTDITVAQALEDLNGREELTDQQGSPADPIIWECNCLQKKCGACAMLIDGFPALACEAKIADHGGKIELQPLSKFPTVKDLMVDRSEMFENLKKMRVWMNEEKGIAEARQKEVLTASGCLQCGCCLEVCTGYTGQDEFYGTAALAGAARIAEMEETPKADQLQDSYKKHFYRGCGEFNACEHYCPANLPINQLMAHLNTRLR